MFHRLGQWIARNPGAVIALWALALAAGVGWSLSLGTLPPAEVGSFLPDDAPNNVANRIMREAFPQLASLATAVVIIEREEGLTEEDLRWLNSAVDRAAKRIGEQLASEDESQQPRIVSPSNPVLRERMVSPERKAALALINLQSHFISERTIHAVETIESTVHDSTPNGLTVEITGQAGIGRDFFLATREALDRTTWVTIIAVLVILTFVYRSPIGAMVPLLAVGSSVYLAIILLKTLAWQGWSISNMEHLFAVVLLFGAGVDYAFFWVARYREELAAGSPPTEACAAAMRSAGPAILASALTTICGLSTLFAADLLPAKVAGQVLPIALSISLVAALTLIPALVRVFRGALFWPSNAAAQTTFGQKRLWPFVAAMVTRRPRTVFAIGGLILLIPGLYALTIQFRFDSLSQLPEGTSSKRGFDIAHRHFPQGEIYSTHILVDFDAGLRSAADARPFAHDLTRRMLGVEGVVDVYALSDPVGTRSDLELGFLMKRFAGGLYYAHEPSVLRFEVLIEPPPFSYRAMDIVEQLQTEAREALRAKASEGWVGQVYFAGLTSYIVGVRNISDSDQLRIMILASLVIGVIVYLLLRDLPMTLFMILATWLTFGAAITFSEWVVTQFAGLNGLDYKVRLIVFVIMVAVGQDYNIFLVTRWLQEPPEVSDAEAVRRAIVSTGSVISSCGLIMAATLGSLWAGGLSLLQQTGLALASGILIDTFFVRPILIPSFFLATKRRRHRNRSGALRNLTDNTSDSTFKPRSAKVD